MQHVDHSPTPDSDGSPSGRDTVAGDPTVAPSPLLDETLPRVLFRHVAEEIPLPLQPMKPLSILQHDGVTLGSFPRSIRIWESNEPCDRPFWEYRLSFEHFHPARAFRISSEGAQYGIRGAPDAAQLIVVEQGDAEVMIGNTASRDERSFHLSSERASALLVRSGVEIVVLPTSPSLVVRLSVSSASAVPTMIALNNHRATPDSCE